MTGKMLIPRGLPASGKTRWAREYVNARPPGSAVRLNRDDLRGMCLPVGYRTPTYAAEDIITKVQQAPIVALLRSGVDVIVDDTNLRTRYVKAFAMLAEQAGATWECVDQFLTVDVDTCILRDALRDRPVGEDVIRTMHAKFLHRKGTLPLPVLDAAVTGKPYIPVPGTPAAVLVDIDGTVALHCDRNPYDTSRYHEDTPNTPVVEAIRMEHDAGRRIIFSSGRSAEFRVVTAKWLHDHVLPIETGWELNMRPAGDTRNDAIVKLELFDQHVRDRFDVRRAYDDRDRVVAGYRSIGLTVLQVCDGAF